LRCVACKSTFSEPRQKASWTALYLRGKSHADHDALA
jgi:hypothetical protein